MKICASFSYQCGLEICPTEISKLFLIKITSRSLICNKSQSLSLQVFTFYKKIHLSSNARRRNANFLQILPARCLGLVKMLFKSLDIPYSLLNTLN